MTVMNPFIDSNLPILLNALENFSVILKILKYFYLSKKQTIPKDNINIQNVPIIISDEQRESDMELLHHYLALYLEKIARNLQFTENKVFFFIKKKCLFFVKSNNLTN